MLTPRLLSEGYNVTVYDALYFGCRLPNDPKLRVIQGDTRDTPKLAAALAGQDAVLHLACISNDASFEGERLSRFRWTKKRALGSNVIGVGLAWWLKRASS